jgi:dihydrofolate synthase/folylpolyglutamate synthase
MLAAMLQANGLKVGLYTSPHLIDVHERIQVDGENIGDTDLGRVIARVAEASSVIKRGEPTFFEVVTAAAFQHFADQKVDIAIIETGLGGRLDSTNVLPKPAVCGITSISLDHVDQLGHTLEQIAEEKAGIFKSGVIAVSAPQQRGVMSVLRRVAKSTNTPLRVAGEDIELSYRFERSRLNGPHTRISISTPTSRFEHLVVPMPGDHQAINCGLAVALLDVLRAQGFAIDEEAAIRGLSRVKLAGRMEFICEKPRVLVDGAHNAASIEALMRAIGQNITYDSMVLIFGCNADKDVQGMLRQLQLGADKIIFTSSGSPRACDPRELAQRFGEISGRMAQVEPDLESAIATAFKPLTRDDLLCVAGSFYLVGRAKRLFSQTDFVDTMYRS